MAEIIGYQPEEIKKRGVRFSEFVGRRVLLPVLDRLSGRTKEFDTTQIGLENLEILKERPCLIVSNHIKPEGALASNLQLSPDAFVIQQVIDKATGVKPKIVSKAGDGWWSDIPLFRKIQEKLLPIQKKAVAHAGMIPVIKNPGSINREMFAAIEQAVKDKESLIMFPEGHWYSDDEVHELSEGAALIAIKNKMPIIPVFIRGADKWGKGTPVTISIGEPFMSTGEGKEGRRQTTEMIRDKISELGQKTKE